MYDLDGDLCFTVIVKFSYLGVNNENLGKANVNTLHHSFERSTQLSLFILTHVQQVCAAKQHSEVCFYEKNENLYFHDISIQNSPTRNYALRNTHLVSPGNTNAAHTLHV